MERIGKIPYEKKRLKHEPTPSYFHLVRQLVKFMMRCDKLIGTITAIIRKKTAPPSNVNVTDEDKSKEIIMHETLSENNSRDVSKSEYFTSLMILHFSLQLLIVYKRKMQVGH